MPSRVAEQISKLSEVFELMPGGLIYAGAPENVGPVLRGDVMEGRIDGLPNLLVRVACDSAGYLTSSCPVRRSN